MANVLVVDDQQDLVELTTMLLEEAGHHVTSRGNGESALRSMQSGELPDCVLLDVEMPGISGPGVAHQMLIRDAGKESIPIILTSGRQNIAEIADKMGTPYFLRKGDPGYGRDLLGLVIRATEEKRAPESA